MTAAKLRDLQDLLREFRDEAQDRDERDKRESLRFDVEYERMSRVLTGSDKIHGRVAEYVSRPGERPSATLIVRL